MSWLMGLHDTNSSPILSASSNARTPEVTTFDSITDYERYAKAYWSGISDSCPGAITPGQQWEEVENEINLITDGLDPIWMKDRTVLEYGCGEGRLIAGLTKKFQKYIGVDISPTCIERSKSLQIAGSEFRLIDSLFDLTDKHDCIVSWTVFMHMPEKIFSIVIKHLADLLNPGGHLCFQLSFFDQREELRVDLVPDSNLWNSRWYPNDIAEKIITESGLRILKPQRKDRGAWWTIKA